MNNQYDGKNNDRVFKKQEEDRQKERDEILFGKRDEEEQKEDVKDKIEKKDNKKDIKKDK